METGRQEIDNYKTQVDGILYGIVDQIKHSEDTVVLDEEVKNMLRSSIGDYNRVKKALQKAITFVKTLQFGLNKTQLVLLPIHFKEFESETIKKKKESNEDAKQNSYVSNTKTYQFLEDLETAAEKLSIKGHKLTSARVGQSLGNPITAAAISDKIKNHSRKIIMLLEQYPEKWLRIRNRFRPIINIQERAKESKVA